jgi:EAL domain-containing protein (putative c-di-GMP-specific phosphodiesterase class I)
VEQRAGEMGDQVADRASRFQRWQHRLADTPASLEADARAGVATERFYLLYQPRVRCADGDIRVVEALLRWHDATRGDMHPGLFLPSLAETAVMGDLGRWVLDRACAQAAAWDRDRPADEPPVAVAVNVGVSELRQDGFVELASAALGAADLRPELLVLELDARGGVPADRLTVARLAHLRHVGISVTLDGVDPPLPPRATATLHDGINLDRRGVRRVETAPALGAELVRAAHDRSLTLTAVGVERQDQADLLTRLGFDQLQGYHLGEPVRADELGWQRPTPVRPTGPTAVRGRRSPGRGTSRC